MLRKCDFTQRNTPQSPNGKWQPMKENSNSMWLHQNKYFVLHFYMSYLSDFLSLYTLDYVNMKQIVCAFDT